MKIITPLLVETRAFHEGLFGLTVVEEWNEPWARDLFAFGMCRSRSLKERVGRSW